MGVFIFLQKRALLSELLSHATYPGLALGGVLATFSNTPLWFRFPLGAFVSCALALWLLQVLEKQKLSQDAAMSTLMSGFFACGLLLTSYLQNKDARIFLEMQKCFFGEVATLLDEHVIVYAILCFGTICFCYLFYRKIQWQLFDPQYIKISCSKDRFVDIFSGIFLIAAIIIGIRSCGVLLVSAMLIAPVAAARMVASSLASLFVLSGLFGLFSGFLGNYLSIMCVLGRENGKMFLPPGPMIVLIAGLLVVLSYLFAPQKGLLAKSIRIFQFRFRAAQENCLKALCSKERSLAEMQSILRLHRLSFFFFQRHMKREGLVQGKGRDLHLTEEGKKRALRIVRFHRLWEVYLTKHMDVSAKNVHPIAEEMEHVITPDLEKRLDHLLQKPEFDPHDQPIPKRFS